MNTGAPWPEPMAAEERVLGIQRKLHKWARDDRERRFCDLHNLVCDPATLLVAWLGVRANRGSRSAGVDGQTAYHVEQVLGVERFLAGLREQLRSGSYRPAPVREKSIPKRGGKRRRLGIPTIADRVVQAALKLVLEPVFEADFQPCSYGYRPGRGRRWAPTADSARRAVAAPRRGCRARSRSGASSLAPAAASSTGAIAAPRRSAR